MPRRFICTADVHLWLRREAPVSWQSERYMQLFEFLIEACLHHHAELIIAGDLWEKCEPELEEQELAFIFFRMCREAGVEVYLIGGNHESIGPGKDTFQYLDMGKDKTIKVNYQPKPWVLQMPEEDCTLHFLSHCGLGTYHGPPVTGAKLNILISHFRCNYNQFVKEEIDVDHLLEPFDLAVVGDIHAGFSLGKLIYTNHPINKEFQSSVDTGVLLLTIDKGAAKYERIATNLPSLIQIRIRADEEFPPLNETDFYRIEVTGTVPELKNISAPQANVKLVKVPEALQVLVQENGEQEEITNRSLDEELALYLKELGYDENKIDRMMTVWKEAA